MNSTLGTIMLYSTGIAIGVIGFTLLCTYFYNWINTNKTIIMQFVGGLALGQAFLVMLPGSNFSSYIFEYTLAGMMIFFFLTYSFLLKPEITKDPDKGKGEKIGNFYLSEILFIFFLIFHSIIEGILMGMKHSLDANANILQLLTYIFHEVPEVSILLIIYIIFTGIKDIKKVITVIFLTAVLYPLFAYFGYLLTDFYTLAVKSNIKGFLAGWYILIGFYQLILAFDGKGSKNKIPIKLLSFFLGLTLFFIIRLLFGVEL